MKALEHIEMLLKQGKKSKELIELGFAKQAVTRAKRRLKDENARSHQEASIHKQDVAVPLVDSDERIGSLLDEIKVIRQKLAELEAQVESTMTVEEVKNLFNNTPVFSLKNQYECECGSKGMVAFRFKCTNCDKENWWGWFPEKK